MNASELIAVLQALIAAFGDLEVGVPDERGRVQTIEDVRPSTSPGIYGRPYFRVEL